MTSMDCSFNNTHKWSRTIETKNELVKTSQRSLFGLCNAFRWMNILIIYSTRNEIGDEKRAVCDTKIQVCHKINCWETF